MGDIPAAEMLDPPRPESCHQPAQRRRFEHRAGQGAQVRILTGYVPVVPHESLGVTVACRADPLLELAPQDLGVCEEVGDDCTEPKR